MTFRLEGGLRRGGTGKVAPKTIDIAKSDGHPEPQVIGSGPCLKERRGSASLKDLKTMGMPLNSFTVMQALLHRHLPFHQRDQFDPEVAEALRKYNLLALVLHSPERHPEFNHRLQRDFEIYDRTTGGELLFFAVVEPSRDWLRNAARRDYFQIFTGKPLEQLKCSDPDAALCALARAFSVTQLPAVVVMNPKDPDETVVLQTSALEVEQQLSRLGFCAADYQREIPLSNQLDKWSLNNIHQSAPREFASYRALLAFAGMAARERRHSKPEAENLLHAFLRDAPRPWKSRSDSLEDLTGVQMNLPRSQPETGVQEYPDEPDEYAVGLLLDLAYYLGSMRSVDAPAAERLPRRRLLSGVARGELEIEASAALASAEAILSGGAQLEDFSPLMICVAKAFEAEINASLVQWYRKKLGVEMPRYFKLHAPNVTALAGEGQPVDFNAKRRQGEWHPPSLGQSLWAGTRHFAEQPSELTPEQFAHLAEIWGHILPLRNRAAHSGSMDRSEFLYGAELWMKLKQERLLAKLLDLKLRLKLTH